LCGIDFLSFNHIKTHNTQGLGSMNAAETL